MSPALPAGAAWARAAPALAWGILPIALSFHPAAAGALPALALLRGPLGMVWAGLALAVALGVLFEGPRPWSRRLPPVALFAASAGLLTLIGVYYTSRMQATGDEPHYLVMAQSLWREGDLDLRDNYARQDYHEFTPGSLTPHYGRPRADGRPFPAHSPGLPLLLAPAYALGGRALCAALFALFAAALAEETRRLALLATGNPRAALTAWALAIGPPVALYSFHTYTELPSALALALSLRLLLEDAGVGRAALAGSLAGALPWLHPKMIPAAAVLAALGLVRLRGRPLLAFLAVAAAEVAALCLFYWRIFGNPTPLAVYGGVPEDESGQPLRALVGLLLDRSFGLLPHAPLFLLALAAFPFLRGRWRSLAPQLLVGAAVIAPVLPWRMWWGGQCPPARFLVPLVPLLAVLAALRVAASESGLARWRTALAALGVVYLLFVGLQPERLLLVNRGSRPTRLWEALSPSPGQVAHYLPSLVARQPDDWRVAVVWLLALAALLALDLLASRRRRVDAWFSGLALPAVVLLAVGLGVDFWARPAGPSSGPSAPQAPIAAGTTVEGVATPPAPR